jgi:NAD(P)-dependent dehydrogenase (short-subunit alcohol dehydrogenase family)
MKCSRRRTKAPSRSSSRRDGQDLPAHRPTPTAWLEARLRQLDAARQLLLRTKTSSDGNAPYQLSKRGYSLRVAAEAVRWGRRGARVNTISPGIVITPLANDELSGPRGEGYRRMIESSPMGRAGTPDEVAAVGALLMGPDGDFITGSDFLTDGGVTAAYWYGALDEVRS